jgi:hypothetical protein
MSASALFSSRVQAVFGDAAASGMMFPAAEGVSFIDLNTVPMPARHAWGAGVGSKHIADFLQNARDACVTVAREAGTEMATVATDTNTRMSPPAVRLTAHLHADSADMATVCSDGGRVDVCHEYQGVSGSRRVRVVGTLEFGPGKRSGDVWVRACNPGFVTTRMWVYGHTTKPVVGDADDGESVGEDATAEAGAPMGSGVTDRHNLGGFGQGAKMLCQALARGATRAAGTLEMQSLYKHLEPARGMAKQKASRRPREAAPGVSDRPALASWTFAPVVRHDPSTDLKKVFIEHSATSHHAFHTQPAAVRAVRDDGAPCCVVSTLTLHDTTVAEVTRMLQQNPFWWPHATAPVALCDDAGVVHASVVWRASASDIRTDTIGSTMASAQSQTRPLLFTVGGIFLSDRERAHSVHSIDLHVGYMPTTTEGRFASAGTLAEQFVAALEAVGDNAQKAWCDVLPISLVRRSRIRATD